jgi:hypothetical protein
MSTAPILTAETIIATAVRNALASAVGTYNSRPKVYYQLAEQGAPKPLLVYQFQSDIGRVDRIGDVGASALVTVKALAESAVAARELLELAAPLLDGLSYEGYTVTARYLRSPIIPPLSGTYQSAHTFRITIERNP